MFEIPAIKNVLCLKLAWFDYQKDKGHSITINWTFIKYYPDRAQFVTGFSYALQQINQNQNEYVGKYAVGLNFFSAKISMQPTSKTGKAERRGEKKKDTSQRGEDVLLCRGREITRHFVPRFPIGGGYKRQRP